MSTPEILMRQSPGNKIYIKNLECEKPPMIIVAGEWENDQGGRFYRDTQQITTVEQIRVLQEESWNDWHFYKTTLPYSDASTLLYNSDEYESSEWDNSYFLPLISDDELESIFDHCIVEEREREEAAKILGETND